MKFGIKTLDDFDVAGKTVLCRVDINQPVDKASGRLKDTTRILGSLPTIRELQARGAKTVLLAHQGSDVEYKNYYSLKPHADVLSELLDMNVQFVEDVCGPAALDTIRSLKNGEILLLENVRFMAEEMTLFETKLRLTPEEQAKTQCVVKLAPLADIYVCDAFAAAHRAQPTLIGMEEVLPSAMGRLFEKEYAVLAEILERPKKPCVFVLGGAKIQDAFLMMGKVLKDGIADRVLCGGLVGNVMLAAKGAALGKPSMDFIEKSNLTEYVEASKALLRDYGDKLALPMDLAYVENGVRKEIKAGQEAPLPLVDIGSATAEAFAKEIESAACVFVNGPMGIFEEADSELGTKLIWLALAKTGAQTILGGGDSIAATNKYGYRDEISYICTGGGAMVRFLSGEELPVVAALKKAAARL